MLHVKFACRVRQLLTSGRVRFLWLGMPCTTFSRARKNDGWGLHLCAAQNAYWGLPYLSGSDQRKLQLQQGNQLFLFTMSLIKLCMQLNIPFVLENPKTIMAWEMLPWLQHDNTGRIQYVDLDFCRAVRSGRSQLALQLLALTSVC